MTVLTGSHPQRVSGRDQHKLCDGVRRVRGGRRVRRARGAARARIPAGAHAEGTTRGQRFTA